MSDKLPNPNKTPIGEAGGQFVDAVFSRLPPSAGIGFAGVGAFFILWKALPSTFVGYPRDVVEWVFAAGILLCSFAIVRGVIRGR